MPAVALDPERVQESLVAVIANAIDASAIGETVVVRARRAASAVPTLVVEVEDRGVGIAPDDLPRVLDPFFTRKPVGQGSGLGLAVARHCVEQHGGTIEVKSRLGEGTLVRLTCPGIAADVAAQ
jgi:signal transduction histidine kinase